MIDMRQNIFAFAFAASLAPAPAHAITGPAQEGSPAASSLLMLLNERGFCTANVIAKDVLLTAAHCVHNIKGAVAYWPGLAPEAFVPAKNIVIHPGYRPDAPKTRERSIDLALVRLERTLPASFTPLTIDYEARVELGTPFTISGFGLRQENDGKTAGSLHSATLVTREPLSKLLIWAKDPQARGRGGCTGDSGGAFLSSETKLVAITVWSAGVGNKACGDLTQALRLGPERDFIEKTLAGWAR
jgi:V8-like Glu-specific endopeptidase